MLSMHSALISYVRRRTLAGASAREIAPHLRSETKRSLARLERGLGDYAVKRA